MGHPGLGTATFKRPGRQSALDRVKADSGQVVTLAAGDSITAGQSLNPGEYWPPAASARIRGGNVKQFNKAASGRKIADLVSTYATEIKANYSATVINLLSVFIGTNDLNTNTNVGVGATYAAALFAYLDTVKADGPLVIVWTVPKSTALSGQKETERQAYNAAIVDPVTGVIATGRAHAVIRTDLMAEFQASANTTWLLDGTHPTALTCQAMGAAYAKAANDLLGYQDIEPRAAIMGREAGAGVQVEARAELPYVTLSASDVTTLTEVGAGGFAFTYPLGIAGSGGNRPAWVADEGDGFPCIEFDGTNTEALAYNGVILPGAGPYYRLLVVKTLATGSNGYIWGQVNAGATRGSYLQLDVSSPSNATFGTVFDSGLPAGWTVGEPDDPSVRSTPKVASAVWKIVELINDGTRYRISVRDIGGAFGTEISNNIPNAASVTPLYETLGGLWYGPGFTVAGPKSMRFRHYIGRRNVPTWSEREGLVRYVSSLWLPRHAEVLTDQALTPGDTNFHDLLTVGPRVSSSDEMLEISLMGNATKDAGLATFQILVDAVAQRQSTLTASTTGPFGCRVRVPVAAGSHTIKAQYKVAAGTLSIRPATQPEFASLSVRAA
jgi:lysophospholipase L1-like esterase